MLERLRLLFAFCVALVSAVLGLLGVGSLGGAVNGWLDGPTHFAPLWGAAALLTLAVALVVARGGTRRLALASSGAAVVAALLLTAPELHATSTQERAKPSPDDITVVTHNLFKLNADPQGTIAVLQAANADLVLVQEAYWPRSGVVREWLRRTYPHAVLCPQPWSECEVAIFSRFPVLESGAKPRRWGDRFDPSMAAWAVVQKPGRPPFLVATTHYGWPKPPWLQREQRKGLKRILDRYEKADMILTGDFNSAPWSFGLREQDRSFGLIRRTRALSTWPARFHGLPVFPVLPIDHIYAGSAWRTVAVERAVKTGSDHYAVVVRLQRR